VAGGNALARGEQGSRAAHADTQGDDPASAKLLTSQELQGAEEIGQHVLGCWGRWRGGAVSRNAARGIHIELEDRGAIGE
jgi:hypothetical protein